MTKLVGKIVVSIIFLVVFLLSKTDSTLASSSCTICILEVGTASDLGEDYDFVIIGNSSASSVSLSSVQLQYFNNLGVYDSKINLSGTLSSGQTKVFASEKIKKYNPNASSLSVNLYSGGGSLKLIKVLSSSTTEYDIVGWGLTALSETEPIPNSATNIYSRKKNTDDEVVDSGNNKDDFESSYDECDGLKINEIQPFATDSYGDSVDSWVEFVVLKDLLGECTVASSNGKYFTFDVSSLGDLGDYISINSVFDGDTQKYLELPNPSGSLSIALSSKYNSSQPIYVPIIEVEYSNLEKNQSYALINEYGSFLWKKTFQLTEAAENIFLEKAPIIAIGDPDACSSILINEINPNPVGSDTDSEWLEIKNISTNVQSLDQCLIEIDSEKYYFTLGSVIGPSLIERFYSLYNEDGNEKSVYLRNSEEAYVSLSRIYGEEVTLLQAFTYSDAPEEMSYARFDEGWAWTYSLTPGETNVYLSTKPKPITTESRASFANNAKTSTLAVSTKSSASTKKSTSSSKNLASTAKATTGAKINNERDIYQEPEKSTNTGGNYVFVVIGVLAILYAIYEYKVDIQNYYFKWRRNKTISQQDRQTS